MTDTNPTQSETPERETDFQLAILAQERHLEFLLQLDSMLALAATNGKPPTRIAF